MPRKWPLLSIHLSSKIRMFFAFRKSLLTVALSGCVVISQAAANDWTEARSASTQNGNLSPAQQLVERGQSRLARGEYAAARADFVRAWRAGDHSPEVHRHLVRCLVGEQKLGIAEEEAYRLLEEHPEMIAVHVTLAQIAFFSENYPQAIEHATTAISQNARMADACFIRAYAHARLGNLNMALTDVRISIAEPNRETDYRAEAPHLLHGAILQQLQSHRDALLAYERALRVNDHSMDALLGQWKCYQELQLVPAAFLVANEMQTINPNAVETLHACAVSHRQFAEYDVASQYAVRWSEMSPSDPQPCLEQSRSLSAMRKWHLSQKALEEALRRDDQNLPALMHLSRLLVTCPDDKVRDTVTAQQLAERACELSDWNSPHVIATLASAHAAQGDTAIATNLMSRCLSLLPVDDDTRSLYAGLQSDFADDRAAEVAEGDPPGGSLVQ